MTKQMYHLWYFGQVEKHFPEIYQVCLQAMTVIAGYKWQSLDYVLNIYHTWLIGCAPYLMEPLYWSAWPIMNSQKRTPYLNLKGELWS